MCIYTPYDRGEVGSYLGFDESSVERRVRSRDHQWRQQAQSESFKRVCDAAQKETRSDVTEEQSSAEILKREMLYDVLLSRVIVTTKTKDQQQQEKWYQSLINAVVFQNEAL